MDKNNVEIVEAYYKAMTEKDIANMEQYLHPDVHFIGPLAEMRGKEAVLKAAKGLISLLKTITIRAKFESGNEVMLAYDFDFVAPMGLLRSAVLMTLRERLIAKIELFYDARSVNEKKEEIFS